MSYRLLGLGLFLALTLSAQGCWFAAGAATGAAATEIAEEEDDI